MLEIMDENLILTFFKNNLCQFLVIFNKLA